MDKKLNIVIIGSGFGGLSSAALLAKDGHKVTVLEKNDMPGGRARVWKKDGFVFDMGPSWYMMPEIFDNYFAKFNKKTSDYYSIKRLDPSYRVFFGKDDFVDIPTDVNKTKALFESIEAGSGQKLQEYLDQAKYQYEVSMKEFIYKDYNSIFDLFNWRMLSEGRKLHVFDTLAKFTRRYFKSEKLRKILEYSMVFLGGAPNNTPAIYSVINHADLNLGVWYPMGGFGKVVESFVKLGDQFGVKYIYNSPVTDFEYKDNKIVSVKCGDRFYDADVVINNADYYHMDQQLLDPKFRDYSPTYWGKRTVAPSAFILYVGLNKKLKNIDHHTLFLDEDWVEHFNTIFSNPDWPQHPSYYVCSPSVSDPSVAPEGYENLFFLAPIASGLEDNEEIHKHLKENIYSRFENITGQNIRDSIVVERIFSGQDFTESYNAFKGTGLSLAHTLMQTAYFRPRMRSKKLSNLYHVGHYTQPGVGVPMVVISGEIVANKILNEQK